MKKAFVMAVAFVLMTACGSKTKQDTSATDSLTTDTLLTDSIAKSVVDKHSETYIRQRIESIYQCYRDSQFDESGVRVMEPHDDFDKKYCTISYLALMNKAIRMAGDDDIVLDKDHWTNSQDDNDFTYIDVRISDVTETTAYAEVVATNFGKTYAICLALLFERDDWYVDDFFTPNEDTGELESEKEYFTTIVHPQKH